MEEIINFLHKVGDLKKVKRAGWVNKGIDEGETVAEHTFRTSLMALLLSKDTEMDTEKCIKIALVHDLAEVEVGDITPHDGITPREKHAMEEEAILHMIRELEDSEIHGLWREYNERASPEAEFVKQLDKLELMFQTLEYEKEHPEVDLDEFWENVDEKITNPRIREMFEFLRNNR